MNRTNLSADRLYSLVRDCFGAVPEHRKNTANIKISIPDALMSGLAIFSLKRPSLLSLEKLIRPDTNEGRNIRNLFGIKQPASDTQMRDIIDPIDPENLRRPFRKIFARIQRTNVLKEHRYLDEGYTISSDVTGSYSSSKIRCDDCIEKKHSSGERTYHHQLSGAAIVHPEKKTVIPLCPEPVSNRGGNKKQDCELKAAARWVEKFRREHPKLEAVMLLDALYPNGPFIDLLKEKNLHFIIGAKPAGLKALFDQYKVNQSSSLTQKHEVVETTGERVEKRVVHKFEFINGLDLNGSRPDIKVNFVEYSQTTEYVNPEQDKTGKGAKVTRFTWITDIGLSSENIYKIMRAGRARWKIENETFKTLKEEANYNFTHSYGHGKKNLCTILGMLAMLAFLIDQAQEAGCELFRGLKKIMGTKRDLWESFKRDLHRIVFDCWKTLYELITGARKVRVMWVEDTS